MTTKNETVARRRNAHHRALEFIAATVGCKTDGLKLWRKLMQIERQLYPVCEHYTNGTGGVTIKEWGLAKDKARADLLKLFGGTIPAGVYINGDPRGHMLKLDCDETTVPDEMQRDMGGNGILAATINEE